MSEPAASWLANGMEWYLENEGTSMDEALLLKPAPGKPTIWRHAYYQQRREALIQLAEAVDGISWKSAETIAGWLKELDAKDGLAPAGVSDEQLRYLKPIYLGDAPRSARRVWDIIRQVY